MVGHGGENKGTEKGFVGFFRGQRIGPGPPSLSALAGRDQGTTRKFYEPFVPHVLRPYFPCHFLLHPDSLNRRHPPLTATPHCNGLAYSPTLLLHSLPACTCASRRNIGHWLSDSMRMGGWRNVHVQGRVSPKYYPVGTLRHRLARYYTHHEFCMKGDRLLPGDEGHSSWPW